MGAVEDRRPDIVFPTLIGVGYVVQIPPVAAGSCAGIDGARQSVSDLQGQIPGHLPMQLGLQRIVMGVASVIGLLDGVVALVGDLSVERGLYSAWAIGRDVGL